MKRFLLYLLSLIFKTDNISSKYPVSVKAKILDDDRLLIVKNERNKWDLPGGKIEGNDSIKKTLKREIFEELNIDIKISNLVYIDNIIINGVNVLVVVFDAEIISNSPIKLSFENFEYFFFKNFEYKNYKFSNWINKSNILS